MKEAHLRGNTTLFECWEQTTCKQFVKLIKKMKREDHNNADIPVVTAVLGNVDKLAQKIMIAMHALWDFGSGDTVSKVVWAPELNAFVVISNRDVSPVHCENKLKKIWLEMTDWDYPLYEDFPCNVRFQAVDDVKGHGKGRMDAEKGKNKGKGKKGAGTGGKGKGTGKIAGKAGGKQQQHAGSKRENEADKETRDDQRADTSGMETESGE